MIKIDTDENKFEGVDLEDYDSSKIQKYLFRGGVSQGPNPTPIAKVPNTKKGKSVEEPHQNLESQIRKTFEGKIQKWFDKRFNYSKEDINFLENIKRILTDNQNDIIQKIVLCTKDIINKKETKLLTIKIKQNNEWKYIGDFEVFRKSLKETETQKAVEISARDKDCSICGTNKGLSFRSS